MQGRRMRRECTGALVHCEQTAKLSWKGNDEWPGQGGGCGDESVRVHWYCEQTVRLSLQWNTSARLCLEGCRVHGFIKVQRVAGRGLHSFTFQLNLSALYGIGGARRGCVARVKGVFGGVQGV